MIDNIQPDLLLEDNVNLHFKLILLQNQALQGESQKQLIQIIDELQSIDQDFIWVDKQSVAQYHEKLEQLNKVLTKVLNSFSLSSNSILDDPLQTNIKVHIFLTLIDSTITSSIFALKASLSSALRALPIINHLIASKTHALLFLEQNGLKLLLDYLIDKDSHQSQTYFRLQILQTIYLSTNHIEYCKALIQEDSVQEEEEESEEKQQKEESPKKKKNKKKHKKDKKKKDKKKKKKKVSRSRSRSKKDKDEEDDLQLEDGASGMKIIAFIQGKLEDEKISMACYYILSKLKIYLEMRELRYNLEMFYQNKQNYYADSLADKINFINNNLDQHFHLSCLLENQSFVQVVTKDAIMLKQRELSYAIYDAEKTKVSNHQLVKEVLKLNQRVVSQQTSQWIKELQLIKYVGVCMSLGKENLQDSCCNLVSHFINVKGGLTALCQDYQGLKLVINSLQDTKLGSLIKSSICLINILDHIYVKLLGNDFDCVLIGYLNKIDEFARLYDEKSQKAFALHKIFKNDFFQEVFHYMYNAKDVQELLEKEVEISILNDIFYNILRFGDGDQCLLLSDRLIPQNRKFIHFINQVKNTFSQGLRQSQAMLAQILEPYEFFLSKDTTKLLREIFHENLKFLSLNSDPDINKLKEYFGVYDREKLLDQMLRDEIKLLGLFNKPNQKIEFLDGSLQIFKLLIDTNKNYFIPFFENEVLAGMEFFGTKLSIIFECLLSKNRQIEYMCQKQNNNGRILRDYLEVSYRVVGIILERLRYRYSLGSDKQFHSENLCKILIEFWISISKVLDENEEYNGFSLFNDNSVSGYNSKNKGYELLNMLKECLDYIIQLNNISDDENKMNNNNSSNINQNNEIQVVFQRLYIRCFKHIDEQKYILQLLSKLIISNNQKPILKNISQVLFKTMKRNDDEFENYTKNGDLAFLLDDMNDQTCLQNLMEQCVLTYSYPLKQSFFQLLTALLQQYDHNITSNIYKMTETIIQEQLQKLNILFQSKNDDNNLYDKFKHDWLLKTLFLIQPIYLAVHNPAYTYIFNYEHLDDKLIQMFNLIQTEFTNQQSLSHSYLYLLYNLRILFLKIFTIIMDHTKSSLQENNYQYLIENIPHITHQQNLFFSLQSIIHNPYQTTYQSPQIQHLSILSLEYTMLVLKNAAKNIVGQIIILYSDYSETVFKPKPILNLCAITQFVYDYLQNPEKQYQLIFQYYIQLLLRLTYQPIHKIIHNGEVRKRAINQLAFQKNQNFITFLNHVSSQSNDQKISYIVQYLLSNFSSSTPTIENDERDTNITLPSEPRQHKEIFDMYIKLYKPKYQITQKPMSSYFLDLVLDHEKSQKFLKYKNLIISKLSPWEQVFRESKQEDPDSLINEKFLYEQEFCQFVKFQIPDYPKIQLNDIISLQDRTPLHQRERKGLARHYAIKVEVDQMAPQFDMYDTYQQQRNRYPQPQTISPYQNYPPYQPINQTPAPIPQQPTRAQNIIPQPSLLGELAPPQRQLLGQHYYFRFPLNYTPENDPRLKRQNQITNNSGSQQQNYMPPTMMNQYMYQQYDQQVGMIPAPGIPNQINVPQQQNNRQQQQQQQQQQIIPPQMSNIQHQQQQQVQQPQQQQQKEKQGTDQIASIIANMTEEEKQILRNYVSSEDPRREQQLKEYVKQYPRINSFVQAIRQQKHQQK